MATLNADIDSWHDLTPGGAVLDAFVVAADLVEA
jgi:hypothetical protein